MKTILYDLNEKYVDKLEISDGNKLINVHNCNKSCIGCFSCWIKHPTKCAVKDEYSHIVKSIAESDELIIISKCRYGCYDNKIKKVLERCIGYVLPYFTIRNKQIHHESRYTRKLKLCAYLYGDISKEDKICVHNLVKANAINLNAEEFEVKYFKNIKEIIKCIH